MVNDAESGRMMAFTYRQEELFCDDLALAEIARQIETPFYLYSASALRRNFLAFRDAFSQLDATICFAVKACSNLAILRLLGSLGAGADTVSEGEVRRALLAGIAPEKIIFSGVGKNRAEIAFALEAGVGQLNVESIEELEIINEIAATRAQKAAVSFRLNPDVDAGTHEKISTGRKADKFGIPWSQARDACRVARERRHLELQGLACHIGSQITELKPFEKAFAKITELSTELVNAGIPLRRIDLGGGLGVRYENQRPPSPADYAAVVRRCLRGLNLKLFLEPGRAIAASAGALISRVTLLKQSEKRNFLILDAGMNDLIRPAMYDAYHEIIALRRAAASQSYEVVGPICESSDIFGSNRQLPPMSPGDLVAILDAGAYGASMSSNYNTRPLPAEILVDGNRMEVIRNRQTFEEIIAGERPLETR